MSIAGIGAGLIRAHAESAPPATPPTTTVPEPAPQERAAQDEPVPPGTASGADGGQTGSPIGTIPPNQKSLADFLRALFGTDH